MVHTGNGQEETGGDYRQAITCRWTDGQDEVLVVGDEVWEEWTGSAVEDPDWGKGSKDEWAVRERAVSRRIQRRDVDRDQVYDKG